MLGSTTSGVKAKHWLVAGLIVLVVAALGFLSASHVLDLADQKATSTAARVATYTALDAVARRPIVIPEVLVQAETDGSVLINETVQVREDCQGERLERWALWPDGRSERVVPESGDDSWPGSTFTSTLSPGAHHLWVRYRWPPGIRPILYFVQADYTEARCASGFTGRYLALYRELEPG